jgi:hypothetical protein
VIGSLQKKSSKRTFIFAKAQEWVVSRRGRMSFLPLKPPNYGLILFYEHLKERKRQMY